MVSVVERVPIKMTIKAATIARKPIVILGDEFMSHTVAKKLREINLF